MREVYGRGGVVRACLVRACLVAREVADGLLIVVVGRWGWDGVVDGGGGRDVLTMEGTRTDSSLKRGR